MLEGDKISMRVPTNLDLAREVIWSSNPELQSLNPPVDSAYGIVRFSIVTLEEKHIGSCVVYKPTREGTQIGIQIGDRNYWDKGYGTDTMLVLVSYCFYTLMQPRVWLKVLRTNLRAIKCYQKCGFTQCGRLALGGYDFIMMEKVR